MEDFPVSVATKTMQDAGEVASLGSSHARISCYQCPMNCIYVDTI